MVVSMGFVRLARKDTTFLPNTQTSVLFPSNDTRRRGCLLLRVSFEGDSGITYESPKNLLRISYEYPKEVCTRVGGG